MLDMTDKTVLVTGATSGVGRDGAVRLGEAGARVLIHGRNEDEGARTVELVKEAGGDGSFHRADFADLDSVRGLAETVRAETDELDVLCNNAGLATDGDEWSDQGYELHIAVNHLAPYLLTHGLAAHMATESRIVNTSSVAHRNGGLDLDRLEREGRTGEVSLSGRQEIEPLSKLSSAFGVADLSGLSGFGAYSDSKLAAILFTKELARRLPTGMTANAFHPGVIPGSGVWRNAAFPLSEVFDVAESIPAAGDTVEDGGRALAYLAASPDLTGITGEYYDKTTKRRPAAAGRDERTAARLWTLSADLVGVDHDLPV